MTLNPWCGSTPPHHDRCDGTTGATPPAPCECDCHTQTGGQGSDEQGLW